MEEREWQVWQRVAAGPQPEGGDIRPLLLTAAESVAVYRHLMGLLQGKHRQRIKVLADGARESLDCLKGIQTMCGYSAGNLCMPPVPKEHPRRLLEKRYHCARRQIAEYTARTLDPEFGILWQKLADRERETAIMLSRLIGQLGES